MIKILDNSALSSIVRDIHSLDIMGLLKKYYDIRLTDAVVTEFSNCRRKYSVDGLTDLCLDTNSNPLFSQLVSVLKRKNPNLGQGEIETIASSIILSCSGITNYIVLDDSVARKIAKSIHMNKEYERITKNSISEIKCTGLIGLIKHLRDRGLISFDNSRKISLELEASGFRATSTLLKMLK